MGFDTPTSMFRDVLYDHCTVSKCLVEKILCIQRQIFRNEISVKNFTELIFEKHFWCAKGCYGPGLCPMDLKTSPQETSHRNLEFTFIELCPTSTLKQFNLQNQVVFNFRTEGMQSLVKRNPVSIAIPVYYHPMSASCACTAYIHAVAPFLWLKSIEFLR